MKVCPSCKLVFNHESLPKCIRCGGELEEWHSVVIMTPPASRGTPSDKKASSITTATPS